MTVFYWHGATMAFAWLILIPAGSLIARFHKVRPTQDFPRELDDTWWWNAHRLLQSAAAGLAVVAAWWVYDELGTVEWQVTHVRLGVTVLALAAAQVLSGILRGSKGGPTDPHADPTDPLTWRGDHYDMSLRRRLFELWHKTVGYGIMAVSVAAVWTGIATAGLEPWWQWLALLPVAAYLALFVHWTRQHRRVDTWLAIWGPDGR